MSIAIQIWFGVVGLLLVVAPLANAGFERSCDYNYGSPQGFCGPILSQMLSMICKMYNGKRSDPSMPAIQQPYPAQKSSLDQKRAGIFMPKHEAMSVLDKRASSGTITCECCVHRCDINELSSYCSVVSLTKRSGSQRLFDGIGMSPSSALAERERNDLQEKQRIGRELMRQSPGWWQSVNQLAAARQDGYRSGYPMSDNRQGGEVFPQI